MTLSFLYRVALAIRDGATTVPALQEKFPDADRWAIYHTVHKLRLKGCIARGGHGRYAFICPPAARKAPRPPAARKALPQPTVHTQHLQSVWR